MPTKAKKPKRLTNTQKAAVQANMRLVYSIVKKSKCVHLPEDDQGQEGSIAFANAVQKHRKDGGANLGTYATRAIKNRLRIAEQQDSLIRIPTYLYGKEFAGSHLQEDVRRATQHESIANIPRDDPRHPVHRDDEETEFGWKAMRAVRWAVQKLPPIERDVIRGLVLRGENAGQLSKKHGVRISDVNRYKKAAMAKLRVSLAKHV